MPAFSVSLHVHEVVFRETELPSGQIWCVISIDGASGPVSTSALEAASRMEFRYSVDIPFISENPADVFIYVTVCNFNSDGEMIPLTRSKAKIVKLPLNNANAFRVPLVSVAKPAKEIGYMILSGIIDPPTSDQQRM